MDTPRPVFIVVSGPPASGKSTVAPAVAAQLGLPLVAKDTIKDALMSVLPVPDVEASRQLGRAAVAAMIAVAAQAPRGAVLESNFYRSFAVELLSELPGRVIEVFCRCDRAVAGARYRARAGTRHAGYFDTFRSAGELWNDEIGEPVAGGWPVLEINTNDAFDLSAVLRGLDRHLRASEINYDAAARCYQEGRSIPDASLDRWWQAVAKFALPYRPLRVLDVGAGTGIFARAWARWCDCRVVAMEPSAGMRAEARLVGTPQEVALVAAVGERLPLRERSIDVAWLSAVLHHLQDPRACADELRRVVVPGGAVLVRGFFPDRSDVGWLPFFPGADDARARFPSASATTALFAETGFVPNGAVEVEEPVHEMHDTAGAAAKWARSMRHADTLLGAFSDDDFDRGVAALEACSPNTRLTTRLTLLSFRRR